MPFYSISSGVSGDDKKSPLFSELADSMGQAVTAVGGLYCVRMASAAVRSQEAGWVRSIVAGIA